MSMEDFVQDVINKKPQDKVEKQEDSASVEGVNIEDDGQKIEDINKIWSGIKAGKEFTVSEEIILGETFITKGEKIKVKKDGVVLKIIIKGHNNKPKEAIEFNKNNVIDQEEIEKVYNIFYREADNQKPEPKTELEQTLENQESKKEKWDLYKEHIRETALSLDKNDLEHKIKAILNGEYNEATKKWLENSYDVYHISSTDENIKKEKDIMVLIYKERLNQIEEEENKTQKTSGAQGQDITPETQEVENEKWIEFEEKFREVGDKMIKIHIEQINGGNFETDNSLGGDIARLEEEEVTDEVINSLKQAGIDSKNLENQTKGREVFSEVLKKVQKEVGEYKEKRINDIESYKSLLEDVDHLDVINDIVEKAGFYLKGFNYDSHVYPDKNNNSAKIVFNEMYKKDEVFSVTVDFEKKIIEENGITDVIYLKNLHKTRGALIKEKGKKEIEPGKVEEVNQIKIKLWGINSQLESLYKKIIISGTDGLNGKQKELMEEVESIIKKKREGEYKEKDRSFEFISGMEGADLVDDKIKKQGGFKSEAKVSSPENQVEAEKETNADKQPVSEGAPEVKKREELANMAKRELNREIVMVDRWLKKMGNKEMISEEEEAEKKEQEDYLELLIEMKEYSKAPEGIRKAIENLKKIENELAEKSDIIPEEHKDLAIRYNEGDKTLTPEQVEIAKGVNLLRSKITQNNISLLDRTMSATRYMSHERGIMVYKSVENSTKGLLGALQAKIAEANLNFENMVARKEIEPRIMIGINRFAGAVGARTARIIETQATPRTLQSPAVENTASGERTKVPPEGKKKGIVNKISRIFGWGKSEDEKKAEGDIKYQKTEIINLINELATEDKKNVKDAGKIEALKKKIDLSKQKLEDLEAKKKEIIEKENKQEKPEDEKSKRRKEASEKIKNAQSADDIQEVSDFMKEIGMVKELFEKDFQEKEIIKKLKGTGKGLGDVIYYSRKEIENIKKEKDINSETEEISIEFFEKIIEIAEGKRGGGDERTLKPIFEKIVSENVEKFSKGEMNGEEVYKFAEQISDLINAQTAKIPEATQVYNEIMASMPLAKTSCAKRKMAMAMVDFAMANGKDNKETLDLVKALAGKTKEELKNWVFGEKELIWLNGGEKKEKGARTKIDVFGSGSGKEGKEQAVDEEETEPVEIDEQTKEGIKRGLMEIKKNSEEAFWKIEGLANSFSKDERLFGDVFTKEWFNNYMKDIGIKYEEIEGIETKDIMAILKDVYEEVKKLKGQDKKPPEGNEQIKKGGREVKATEEKPENIAEYVQNQLEKLDKKFLNYSKKFGQVITINRLKSPFDFIKEEIKRTIENIVNKNVSNDIVNSVLYPLRINESKDWEWYIKALGKLERKEEVENTNKLIMEYIEKDKDDVNKLSSIKLNNLKGYISDLLNKIDEMRKERYEEEN